jgi:alginate O-acetyltransferase complex protein AlgI
VGHAFLVPDREARRPSIGEPSGAPPHPRLPLRPVYFNSTVFALFFAAVWVGYWLLRRREAPRVWLLLIASYFFYGYWDPRFLWLIGGSTALDYSIGRVLSSTSAPGRRRLLVTLSLVGNLGALAFFKYWGFFIEEAGALIESLGLQANLPTLRVILPVGISFYTFQTLSYTLDVYRGALTPERNFARFALFVAFFPQLVAGPIVRARDFLPQIPRPPVLTSAAFSSGLWLIFWGLTKKIVLADLLGRELVDDVWSNPEGAGGWLTLIGIYGYALQIYGDFSGYSDCAIGVARLLGFELSRNFDFPYRSTAPREFWRRWHISLSTWLRDYLYISLGGNRGGNWAMYRNLMLTMTLGGLWHGASWMFVIWGVYHGAILVIDRLLGLEDPKGALHRSVRVLAMFQFTCLGWVFFRSQTTGDAWAVLGSLFQPVAEGARTPSALVAWVMAGAFAVHLFGAIDEDRLGRGFVRLPAVVQGVIYAFWVGLLMSFQVGAKPFIYFQF